MTSFYATDIGIKWIVKATLQGVYYKGRHGGRHHDEVEFGIRMANGTEDGCQLLILLRESG